MGEGRERGLHPRSEGAQPGLQICYHGGGAEPDLSMTQEAATASLGMLQPVKRPHTGLRSPLVATAAAAPWKPALLGCSPGQPLLLLALAAQPAYLHLVDGGAAEPQVRTAAFLWKTGHNKSVGNRLGRKWGRGRWVPLSPLPDPHLSQALRQPCPPACDILSFCSRVLGSACSSQ